MRSTLLSFMLRSFHCMGAAAVDVRTRSDDSIAPGTVRVTIEAAMVMAHARKSRHVSVVGVKRQSAELATGK